MVAHDNATMSDKKRMKNLKMQQNVPSGKRRRFVKPRRVSIVERVLSVATW